MNIAELFVRLRGDTSDLDRKLSQSERQLLRLHGSTTRLEGGFRSATFQTGRLGNQFASLAGQIAGVHPIVGNLAQVMGNFAVGGVLTVGILGATAIFATFYDTITKGAREAKKETDAFVKSLVDQAKAAYDATVAGRELALLRAEFALQDAKKSSGLGVKSFIGSVATGRMFMNEGEVSTAAQAVADATTAVRQATKNLGKTWEDTQPPIVKVKGHVTGIKKVVDEIAFSWRDALEAVYMMDNTLEKISLRDAAAMFAPNIDVNRPPGPILRDFGTTISGVDTDIGLTRAGIKARDELIGTLDKNTMTMKDAIWGAASQSAGIIVNALNIGGGGKGSSLGGAIGGTAGFALGFAFGGGPVGGAIGSTIGNITGSLIGGLFDSNTRAVNANTLATQANTQAMLLYAPSGFKAEPYRYNASDPRPLDAFGRTIRWNASRGGANPLLGT